MTQILDHRGNPIKLKALDEPQTARVGSLNHEIAEHPSRGLTPIKIARILGDAEAGDIMAQCDLFEDMEEKDGHIFAEMSKRKRALIGMDWDIEPPLNADAKEIKWAEQIKEYLSDLSNLEDIIFDMADAIGKAFSCQEIEWGLTEKVWMPKEITFRPQRWFKPSRDDRNKLMLRDNSSDGEELRSFGWIRHEHRARSGWLHRSGLHRTLAWPYLFKNYSVRDLAEFLEIYGLPLRVGTYPRGASKDEKSTLLSAVVNIGHDAAGIMPEGMGIDFKEAAKGDKDPFEFMIEWCEKTESKVIVGQTLSSQADGKTSTNALGNVHMEVMKDLTISDCRQLKGTLTRDLIWPLAALNIPGITPDRAPRFKFITDEPEDINLWSEALPKLVDAGLDIPEPWAREKLGIPEAGKDEKILIRKSETPLADNNAALKSIHPIASCKHENDEADVIAHYADQLDEVTIAAMKNLIEPVRKLVMTATSLEAIRDGLIDLYPDYDASELGNLMQSAMAAADLAGRFEVQKDV